MSFVLEPIPPTEPIVEVVNAAIPAIAAELKSKQVAHGAGEGVLTVKAHDPSCGVIPGVEIGLATGLAPFSERAGELACSTRPVSAARNVTLQLDGATLPLDYLHVSDRTGQANRIGHVIDGLPVASVSIALTPGRLFACHCLIDTANPGPTVLKLPSELSGRAAEAEADLQVPVSVVRSGSVTARNILGVRFGRFLLPNPRIGLISGQDTLRDGGPYDGDIGYDWLRRFRVVIDWSRARMLTIPNSQARQIQ